VSAVWVGALLLRQSREDSARWLKVALAQALASLAIAALLVGVSDPPGRPKKSADKEAVVLNLGGLTVRREKDKPPKVTPAAAPVANAPVAHAPGAAREAVPAKAKPRAQGSERAERAVEQAARALARRLGAKVEPEGATAPVWSPRLGLPGEPPAVSPPLALPEDAARPGDDAPLADFAAAVIAAVREDAEAQGDDAELAGAQVAGAAVRAPPAEGAPGAGDAVVPGAEVGSPVGPAAAIAPAAAATDEAEPDDDEEAPSVAAARGSDRASKADDEEEPERFANWPLLAALARWSAAVLGAQLLVVALTRDHSEVTENALARAVGLPVPPPRPPKVRLDVRWLLRRLQRRMWTTLALVPLAIALSPLLLFVPGLGQVLLSLGAAWLVVVGTTAKDGRAWESDLAASEPRSVSALREATTRHRALDWFLPRTLVRLHGRFVRRLQGPMNAAEGAPFELAGVALTRTLALIPFVGLLLRPLVPVAVAAFVPRAASPAPLLEPGAEEIPSAPSGAALPAASPR
jgi:hypothetical protein